MGLNDQGSAIFCNRYGITKSVDNQTTRPPWHMVDFRIPTPKAIGCFSYAQKFFSIKGLYEVGELHQRRGLTEDGRSKTSLTKVTPLSNSVNLSQASGKSVNGFQRSICQIRSQI